MLPYTESWKWQQKILRSNVELTGMRVKKGGIFMKKKSLKWIAVVSAFALTFNMTWTPGIVFAAEDADVATDESDDVENDVDLDEIPEISETKATLASGKELELEIYGDYQDVTWSSSKNSVATVDEDGVVTAKNEGTAVITAEVTYEVYNQDDADETDDADFVAESINGDLTAFADEDEDADVDTETDAGNDAGTDEDYEYEGEDEVQLVSITLTCKITVKPAISKSKVTLKAGKTATLKVLGTKDKVKWSSGNKKVATVKDGKITAVKKGTAVITAKVGSTKLTCTVTVK